ncbi:MAG: xanthine dehydrogenase family protein subunit M [Alphaproteobacteria bacterium]|nr:MAG: xanthine dehydrogenase family protein subunit M [Alphaproteobacteria bacterium]
MKPAKFEYHAPATLDAAIALLAQYQGEARLLAGGQSLLPMMNFRLVTPAAIIDLNRIPDLGYIRAEAGTVRIGAMTRHRAVEFSPVIAEHLPLLAEAIKLVAHLPAAELPMVLQALEGEVVARSRNGERVIKAIDFFEGLMTTSLADDEMIAEVRFPVMSKQAGWAVEEFARRRGDFAIAAIAAVVERSGERCSKARLATAGIGEVSARLTLAEEVIERDGLGDSAIAAAAAKAAHTVSPLSDQQASAEYRRHLTGVLTERALRRARALH